MIMVGIRAGLVIAAVLAAVSVGRAQERQPGASPTSPGQKIFDLDLTAFYRGAAIQGAPIIMLPELQRDVFVAADTPFAFTTPSWSQPGAFGHILDLPPVAR